MDNAKFGKRLRGLMAGYGATSKDLGRLIGIPSTTMSRYIKGSCAPSIDHAIGFARYFGKSIEFILGLDDLRVKSDKSVMVAFTYEIANEDDRKIMENLVDKYRGAFKGGDNERA